MCLLCVEIIKGNMTVPEIARAYIEMATNKTDHDREILELIQEKDPEGEVLDELINLAYHVKYEQDPNSKI